MTLSTYFSAELEEEIELLENQKDSIRSEVTLLDTQLDRYDVVISNIDRELVPLLNEINVGINSVKTAYDNRVAIGCKNDISWQQVEAEVVRVGSDSFNSITYEVKKDASVSQTYNYYGAKFYRKPQNKDYGSNVIGEFLGTISIGSTILNVLSIGGSEGILIGDTITDNVDSPTIFSASNLPTVVGFGTTTIIGVSTELGGTITTGSTILAYTGAGSTLGINTGDSITLNGILPPGTTVVGFSTGTITVGIWSGSGAGFITTSAIVPSLVLSATASSGVTNGLFTVGILSEFSSILLSTSPTSSVTNNYFTAIRNSEIGTSNFNDEYNPVDPVTIDLLSSSKLGKGHKLVAVNNGDPIGPFQWHEIREDPEPPCGASFAIYYPGNELWPTISTFTYNSSTGAIVSVATTYASIGTRVTIGIGSLNPTGIGTTTGKPARFNGTVPSVGVCASYSSSITAYETSLTNIINTNLPKITNLVAKSASLRRLRDKKESSAFSLSQAYDFVVSELNQAKTDLTSLQLEDFSQYDPEDYKPTRRSSVVGIASTI